MALHLNMQKINVSLHKKINIDVIANSNQREGTGRNVCPLSKFAGLEIELCGTWIYVRGETYPYRKELKALGLRFNPHKGCWIIHFDDYYQYHKNPVSMSYIRDKYGSIIINTQEENKENRRLQQC